MLAAEVPESRDHELGASKAGFGSGTESAVRTPAAAGTGAASFVMNSCSCAAIFRAVYSADLLKAGCVQPKPVQREKVLLDDKLKGTLQPGGTTLQVPFQGLGTAKS